MILLNDELSQSLVRIFMLYKGQALYPFRVKGPKIMKRIFKMISRAGKCVCCINGSSPLRVMTSTICQLHEVPFKGHASISCSINNYTTHVCLYNAI